MDAPGLPAPQVAEAYRVLQRVNRQLGNLRTVFREWNAFLDQEACGTDAPRILDVGSGSGDISAAIRDLQRESLAANSPRQPLLIALDRDPTAIGLAGKGGLDAVRGDALRLPFGDRSIDMVMAVKFAHHFSGDALSALIAEMARVARRRVVVVDIRRSWVAYLGFFLWSRVFTRNALVRHDGLRSVLRGFTQAELLELGRGVDGFHWVVRRYLGYQVVLVGSRRGV